MISIGFEFGLLRSPALPPTWGDPRWKPETMAQKRTEKEASLREDAKQMVTYGRILRLVVVDAGYQPLLDVSDKPDQALMDFLEANPPRCIVGFDLAAGLRIAMLNAVVVNPTIPRRVTDSLMTFDPYEYLVPEEERAFVTLADLQRHLGLQPHDPGDAMSRAQAAMRLTIRARILAGLHE